MKYDAFISYRHAPLDMEIAKKLHRGLETFSIPAAVQKKTGKKKIRRVFRDQEELPIGSNLTEEINAALEESEYLIVVCSPETPGSEWVQKEIETFISLRDHSHILAILIDGEPDDSFPPMLLSDESGRPVEPLAADIRGASRKERNRKFKTELLRLAAPLIGCSFDDLRQRHRERLVHKAIAYVTSSALLIGGAGTAFGIYNASIAREMEEMNQQQRSLTSENSKLAIDYMQENRDRQINQSRFYASSAMNLLSDGYRKQAALVARAGLPSPGDYRPYVAEAEYALSSALHAYDNGQSRSFYKCLEHDLPVSAYWKSGNGSRLISLDYGSNVHIWDTATWEEILCIPPEVYDNYFDEVRFAEADEDNVYIMTKMHFYAYDKSGQLRYNIDSPGGTNILNGAIDTEKGLAFLIDSAQIWTLDLSDGSIISKYDCGPSGVFAMESVYNTNTGLLAVEHDNEDGTPATASILQTETGNLQDIELSGSHLIHLHVTVNGNIAALSSPNDYHWTGELASMTLDLFTPDGKKLWSKTIDPDVFDLSSLNVLIRSHTYPYNNAERSSIIVTAEDKVFSFNEADGSILAETSLPAAAISLMPGINDPSGYIACTNGDVYLTNPEIGQVYDDSDNKHIQNMADIIANGRSFIVRQLYAKNLFVLDYQQAPDLETLPSTDNSMLITGTAPSGNYYVMASYGDYVGYQYFDPDGNLIFQTENDGRYAVETAFFGNTFIIAQFDGIRFVNPIEGTDETLSYAELGIDASMITKVHFSNTGCYCAFWNGVKLYVADLEKRCCIYKTETEDPVGSAIPSDDGNALYISEKNKNLYVVTISTGEQHVFEDDRLQEFSDYFGMEYLSLSSDGRYIAMSCKDQKVWVLNTQTEEISGGLPMQMTANAMLRFSENSRYLFLHGRDFTLRIWDIENQVYLNSFATDYYIKYMLYDDADGKVAIVSGYSLYLVDTENYGLCAHVPDCVAYIKDTNSFIQYYKGNVYRTYYKDYKMLIEETERQFPGAELSNAEKVEYNIN